MMNEGISVADALALANGGTGMGKGEGTWIWVFFLFFLLAWGGGGLFGGGFNNAATQGAITRSDLCDTANFNNLQRQIQDLQPGLYNGFYSINANLANGFHGVDNALCTGFHGVNDAIQQSRFDAQSCCCETNRNIDAVRYENARNTSDIVHAIKEDGDSTRALINANTMQDLRDKLATRDRDLMTAEMQISQMMQTANIVDQIKPCAIPAYLTCSPYESSMIASRAYCGGCGYN